MRAARLIRKGYSRGAVARYERGEPTRPSRNTARSRRTVGALSVAYLERARDHLLAMRAEAGVTIMGPVDAG